MKLIKKILNVMALRLHYVMGSGIGIYLIATGGVTEGVFVFVMSLTYGIFEQLIETTKESQGMALKSQERESNIILTAMNIEECKAKNKHLEAEVKALKATLMNTSGERSTD